MPSLSFRGWEEYFFHLFVQPYLCVLLFSSWIWYLEKCCISSWLLSATSQFWPDWDTSHHSDPSAALCGFDCCTEPSFHMGREGRREKLLQKWWTLEECGLWSTVMKGKKCQLMWMQWCPLIAGLSEFSLRLPQLFNKRKCKKCWWTEEYRHTRRVALSSWHRSCLP